MSFAVHRVLAVSAATVLAASALLSVAILPARAATEHVVEIGDGFFSPSSLSVAAGDIVTWVNADDSPHTVTADNGAFDSGNLDPGQSFSATFGQATTIAYHCDYHDEMRASLVVAAGAPAAPAAPAAPEQPQATAGMGAHHAPGAVAGTGQSPDTAVTSSGPPIDAPAILMGFGLLLIGVSLIRRPSPPAVPGRPTGGWRR